MTCPNCGAPRDPGHTYCPDCGRSLPPAGARPPEEARPHTEARPPDEARPPLGDRERDALLVRSKVAIVALWGALAIAALSAITWATEPPEASTGIDPELSTGEFVTSLVVAAIGFAAPLAWLVWQHRAQANLAGREPRMRFSPGWAIGWWIVPFANLFMPFRVCTELLRRSTGMADDEPTPAWFAAWWGLWVGSVLLTVIGSVMIEEPSQESVDRAANLLAAGSAASVPAALLAMRVIRRVTEGQRSGAGA